MSDFPRCEKVSGRGGVCPLPLGHDGGCLFLSGRQAAFITDGGELRPRTYAEIEAREGWRPGGPHGASCYDGPLDGTVVLVHPADYGCSCARAGGCRCERVERPIPVRGVPRGAYEWMLRETELRVVGTRHVEPCLSRVLQWRPHLPGSNA